MDCQEGKPLRTYSPFVDGLVRFTIATGAGLSLVVPMVTMFPGLSPTKSLVTASVAVLLFVMVLSFGFATDTKITVIATATYAAVFVVSVGLVKLVQQRRSIGDSWLCERF